MKNRIIRWVFAMSFLMFCFTLNSAVTHANTSSEQESVIRWLKQHDYLFSESYLTGSQWLEMDYSQKFEIINAYYREHNLDYDVRRGLLALDFMFNMQGGVFQGMSVYAVLDRILSEAAGEERSPQYLQAHS